jgi:F-box protein 9
LERRGKLYDAVACYRKATQLVPDIEFRVFRSEQKRQEAAGSATGDRPNQGMNRKSRNSRTESEGQGEDFLQEDLVLKLSRLTVDDQGNFYLCRRENEETRTQAHFSDMPYEVVVHILKWVVSDQLDIRSLEQMAMVCRGFYLASRDPCIWKAACTRIWGGPKIEPSLFTGYGNNWRTMFIERPRLNFNGVYISRTSYIRQGEASFQDLTYRPCYLVEYYRYLRFFPGGLVLMLTTADEPYSSLSKLRSKDPRHSIVWKGHYLLSGSSVTALFTRVSSQSSPAQSGLSSRRNRPLLQNLNTSQQVFRLQLEVKSSHQRKNCKLLWSQYSVAIRRNHGQEVVNTFELTPNKYPSFWFSRVKSYSATSEGPLL